MAAIRDEERACRPYMCDYARVTRGQVTTTIGFRALPRGFHCAVVSGTRAAPVLEDVEVVDVPKSFELAEGLKFLEDECTRILLKHSPGHVAVREAEYGRSTDASDRARVRVEGAVLAAAARQGRPASVVKLSNIASSMGVKTAKDFLKEDDLRELDWSAVKKEGREAILAAVAVLP